MHLSPQSAFLVSSVVILMTGLVFMSRGFSPGSVGYNGMTTLVAALVVVSVVAFVAFVGFEVYRSIAYVPRRRPEPRATVPTVVLHVCARPAHDLLVHCSRANVCFWYDVDLSSAFVLVSATHHVGMMLRWVLALCRYAKQHELARVQEVARLEAALRTEQDQRRRMRVAAASVGRGNFFEAMPRRLSRRVSRTVGMAALQVRTSTRHVLARRMTARRGAPDAPDGVTQDALAD